MAFPGIEQRCIGGQAAQGAAEFAVPELTLLIALFQEASIVFLDVGQTRQKTLFVDVCQKRNQRADFLAA